MTRAVRQKNDEGEVNKIWKKNKTPLFIIKVNSLNSRLFWVQRTEDISWQGKRGRGR